MRNYVQSIASDHRPLNEDSNLHILHTTLPYRTSTSIATTILRPIVGVLAAITMAAAVRAPEELAPSCLILRMIHQRNDESAVVISSSDQQA